MTLANRFGVYSLLGCITLMPLLVLPAMVGVLVDESVFSEAQAGWAASLGFFGSALVAFCMAFFMHRLDLRKTAVVAFFIAALGDAASVLAGHHPELLMAIRFLGGLGGGAAYTVVVAAFARERHSDRGYGLFVTLQFIVSGLGLFFLPVYADQLGFKGMYLGFAGLNLAGMALCRHIPGRHQASSGPHRKRTELQVLTGLAVVLGTIGFAVFEAANMAQFTYVERYGVFLELGDRQIGLAMMIGSLAGIPGAFAIVLTGDRFGKAIPLTFGIAVAICGLFLLISAGRFETFMAASVMLGFAWAFCLPYIMSLLAALDPGGSAVAAGSASSTVGGAIGPGMAAMLLGDHNFHTVFVFSIGLFLLALLSFLFARSPVKDRHGAQT